MVDIGDTVRASRVFYLPGYGRGYATGEIVAEIEEIREARDTGRVGYVLHWWGSDGPFASHRRGVAYADDCEPVDA